MRWGALLMLGLIVGCGRSDNRLNITGRILKSSAPLTVPDDEYIRVTFFPVTPDGQPPRNTYAASFDGKTGTFRAVGSDGKGIPPGKYRVAIEHERGRRDLLKGKYDGDRSPFEFEIDRKTKPLMIDLDKAP